MLFFLKKEKKDKKKEQKKRTLYYGRLDNEQVLSFNSIPNFKKGLLQYETVQISAFEKWCKTYQVYQILSIALDEPIVVRIGPGYMIWHV